MSFDLNVIHWTDTTLFFKLETLFKTIEGVLSSLLV